MNVYTALKFKNYEDFNEYMSTTNPRSKRVAVSEDLMASVLIKTQLPIPTGFLIVKTRDEREIKIKISSGFSSMNLQKSMECSYTNLVFSSLEDFRAYMNIANLGIENVTILEDTFVVKMWTEIPIPEGSLVTKTRNGREMTIKVISGLLMREA